MKTNIISRGLGYADAARHANTLRSSTDETVRRNALRHLSERMGKLRGLPQKIGQIISMSDDEEKATAFAPLTDAAEPIPITDVEPILERAWGKPVDQVVRSIESRGLAASIGQVHRAVLTDGREVAIKVRYPGIRQALMADLKALGWLSAPVGDLRRGFDLMDYRAEILRDLEEELDYRTEADRQRHYATLLADHPEWRIPGVVAEFSTDRVLVTDWVTGRRIEEAATWSQADRDALGLTLVHGFTNMLFGHGVLHADPHPGNYRFINTGSKPAVVLYDYGSVVSVSDDHRIALLKLLDITREESGDPYKAFAALGFNADLLSPIRSKLAALCRTLLEPFCQMGKYDLSGWRRTERVDDILGNDRWNFRMSGPASLILVMRAFRGVTYYLEQLRAGVSWYVAATPHLNEHRDALDRFDASADPDRVGTFDTLSRQLRIRVTERGKTKVQLTFPGKAVENLPELMDDELRERIEARGIDIDEIVRDVRRSAYQPRELFTLDDSSRGKDVAVWIE